jgi:hypothetical protein
MAMVHRMENGKIFFLNGENLRLRARGMFNLSFSFQAYFCEALCDVVKKLSHGAFH